MAGILRIHSPHWDEELGSCGLHGVPTTPCPQCMVEQHPDIFVTVDHEMLDCMSLDPDFDIKGELAHDGSTDWLLERII